MSANLKTAKEFTQEVNLKELGWLGDARLFRLSEPIEAAASVPALTKADGGVIPGSEIPAEARGHYSEVVIAPAKPGALDGDVTSVFGTIDGGHADMIAVLFGVTSDLVAVETERLTAEEILAKLGYTVEEA